MVLPGRETEGRLEVGGCVEFTVQVTAIPHLIPLETRDHDSEELREKNFVPSTSKKIS